MYGVMQDLKILSAKLGAITGTVIDQELQQPILFTTSTLKSEHGIITTHSSSSNYLQYDEVSV